MKTMKIDLKVFGFYLLISSGYTILGILNISPIAEFVFMFPLTCLTIILLESSTLIK